jgi:uncharacterized protein (TIGR02757 family)
LGNSKLKGEELKTFLEAKVKQFNSLEFIANDPISIPHRFSKKQDIEIAGLFAAVLAWGQRKTIIRKCSELLSRMDNDPHRFILDHKPRDLKQFMDFKHRTFNPTDTLYFIESLNSIYTKHNSLEDLFLVDPSDVTIEKGLINFHESFFSLEDHPHRTKKHIPTPVRKSTCKRMAMYLRWMVRIDSAGVDFGLWNRISPSKLVCPCDLHVDRVARKLKLIKRKQTDWQTVLELTANLRKMDPVDPVKYDFALFSLGVEQKF